MFSIAICDDDGLDLSLILQSVDFWIKQHKETDFKITKFFQSDELIKAINKGKHFDLYLLDIMMPETNGIDLGRSIRKKYCDTPIIYITSYPEFALEAYGIHALRYIIKPINTKELWSALDLALLFYCNKPANTVLIKGIDSLNNVVIDDIMYIENNVRNTVYTLNNHKQIISVRRSGSFEDGLGPLLHVPYIIQTHKSFFINLKYVNTLHSNTIIMDDNKKIPISRKHLFAVRDKYLSFISNQGQLV